MKRCFLYCVSSTLVRHCLVAATLALTTSVELHAQRVVTLSRAPIVVGKRIRLRVAGDDVVEGRLTQVSGEGGGGLSLAGTSRPIDSRRSIPCEPGRPPRPRAP